jgi:hypothetical protein
LHKRIKALLKDVLGDGRMHSHPKITVDDSVSLVVLGMLDTLDRRIIECICRKYGITEPPMKLNEVAQGIGKVKNPDVPIGAAQAASLIRKGLRQLRHPVRLRRVINALEIINSKRGSAQDCNIPSPRKSARHDWH